MNAPALGITFRETMAGGFSLGATTPAGGQAEGNKAGTTLTMQATITIANLERFVTDPNHKGSITGHIDFGPFGQNIPAQSGAFNLFSPGDQPQLKLMVYELGFASDGKEYYLAGEKRVRDDPLFDLWKDTTTLYTELHEGTDKSGPVVGAGILTLSAGDLLALVKTMHALNASSPVEEARALATFGRFFLGQLWDRYVASAGPTP